MHWNESDPDPQPDFYTFKIHRGREINVWNVNNTDLPLHGHKSNVWIFTNQYIGISRRHKMQGLHTFFPHMYFHIIIYNERQ